MPREMLEGVPQGSVPPPTLQLLYIIPPKQSASI
jgi:hypothetical protein